MLQRNLGQIQDQQLKRNQLYLQGPIGKKLEIGIGFQIKGTEAEAEENIIQEVVAIEALMEGEAVGVEDTLEITLSIEKISPGQSICPQDHSDSEKKVKHEVRALILKSFPKEGAREAPRLTQTVKFMKVQVTKTV